MVHLSTTEAAYVGLVGLSVYIANRFLFPRTPAPLPPGPRGWPLLGNLLDWPTEKRWETFTRWRDLYGEITYCNVAGNSIIVLNSTRLAAELLERKGAIYSGRPWLYFACGLVGWDKRSPAAAPYGEDLRTMRRMISKAIGNKVLVDRFAPMQAREVEKFIRNVLDDAPSTDKLFAHIRKLTNSMILSVSHGYQVADGDDAMVALAEQANVDFAKAIAPGGNIVDIFPALDRLPDWAPGTGFRKTAAEMNKNADAFFDTPYLWAKEQIANGTAEPSFVASQFEDGELSAQDEGFVKAAAGSLFGAGSETSISAIVAFFLAMTLYPEVQARAQAEVDTVVGSNQLPTAADRPRMPYVEALCKEALRWAPPTPLGGMRALAEDDIQDGYFIPKGTLVLPNVWAFSRDPQVYRDPEVFDPSRFLGSAPEQDPREYVFGFGRRACSGATLFNAEFFITCAIALATLNITKEVGLDGKVIEPEVDVEDSIFRTFKPFRCTISPRSAKAERLVRDLH